MIRIEVIGAGNTGQERDRQERGRHGGKKKENACHHQPPPLHVQGKAQSMHRKNVKRSVQRVGITERR